MDIFVKSWIDSQQETKISSSTWGNRASSILSRQIQTPLQWTSRNRFEVIGGMEGSDTFTVRLRYFKGSFRLNGLATWGRCGVPFRKGELVNEYACWLSLNRKPGRVLVNELTWNSVRILNQSKDSYSIRYQRYPWQSTSDCCCKRKWATKKVWLDLVRKILHSETATASVGILTVGDGERERERDGELRLENRLDNWTSVRFENRWKMATEAFPPFTFICYLLHWKCLYVSPPWWYSWSHSLLATLRFLTSHKIATLSCPPATGFNT